MHYLINSNDFYGRLFIPTLFRAIDKVEKLSLKIVKIKFPYTVVLGLWGNKVSLHSSVRVMGFSHAIF
jgi:hypothetical protein